jgi:hypothetical protein
VVEEEDKNLTILMGMESWTHWIQMTKMMACLPNMKTLIPMVTEELMMPKIPMAMDYLIISMTMMMVMAY